MTYRFAHRLMHRLIYLLGFLREVCYHSEYWLIIQRPTTANMQRIRDFRIFCPKWISVSHPSPKARGSSRKREAEDYKNHRGRWMTTGKPCVPALNGSCTHGLTAVMTACTRPVKNQHGGGGWSWSPNPTSRAIGKW